MPAANVLRHTQTSNGAAPAQLMQPSSPSEIAAILRNHKHFPGPVRPMGFGSSTTRCLSAPSGTLLDMSKMNRVLRLEKDTVTVQPGISIRELAEILEGEGLELHGGFDLANRSVGGAVCSAGLEAAMGGHPSQFAAHVTSLKVVGPEGNRFAARHPDQGLLGLLRLSYGLLGVVYEVTLKIRPIQTFVVQSARVGFEDFVKLVPRLTLAASGAKLYLMPFKDRIFLELRRPTDEPVRGRKLAWRFRDWACYSALPSALRSLAKVVPIRRVRYPLSDSMCGAAQSLLGKSVRMGSNSLEQTGRFKPPGGKQGFTYCTWAFPASGFGIVARAYRELCLEHYDRTGFRCDMPAIVFRLNRDRSALLAPAFDTPMYTVSSLSTEQAGWDDFVVDLAEFASRHGGVPFFNETPGATTELASARYGKRLAAFRRARRRLDPSDRLLNQYFGGYMF
ncbi:MAG TPA: FAD-binding oxidoreductase [Gammaproteobacteria bacterium]|nr:FAD-binding oxidoreductase [Gammaproteobacteria bacterium]